MSLRFSQVVIFVYVDIKLPIITPSYICRGGLQILHKGIEDLNQIKHPCTYVHKNYINWA